MNSQPKKSPLTILAIGVLMFSALVNCKKSSDTKEIFKDDFNRGSIGGDWVLNLPSGTSFGISSGAAYPVSSGTATTALPAAMYKNKVTGSFKVSAKFSISGGAYTNQAYIIGRSTSADTPANAYVCGYYYSTVLTKSLFMLGRTASSTLGDFADVGMHTLNSGIADTLTLTFDGNTIKCEMSGNSTISVSIKDSTYGDGYIGLIGGGASTNYIYFDDFTAEKL